MSKQDKICSFCRGTHETLTTKLQAFHEANDRAQDYIDELESDLQKLKDRADQLESENRALSLFSAPDTTL